MTIDPRVYAITAEFGIEIIPGNKYPEPKQTRAVATLHRILTKYGEDHFRIVMNTATQTDNNKGCIVDSFLWCVSDLVLEFRHIWDSPKKGMMDRWFSVFDKAPIDKWIWNFRSREKQRYLLQGMLINCIINEFKDQPELFEEWRVA